jgi:hypothetical protein
MVEFEKIVCLVTYGHPCILAYEIMKNNSFSFFTNMFK